MAEFKAYDPRVEVIGEVVKSFTAGVGVFASSAVKILNDNGIKDPQPGQWYPQQSYLNAMKLISERTGPMVLKSIGKYTSDNAKKPPQMDSIESALSLLDVAYKMNHRNGKIGGYNVVKTGARSATVVCDHPYPDSFDSGVIEELAHLFRKSGDHIIVKIDPTKPQKNKGAESTTYVIEW
jgi:hypothetical protein